MKMLKIDPIFRHLELPLNQTEKEALEHDIVEKGHIQTFFTWQGTLLMGFEAFEICKQNDIRYRLRTRKYPSKEVAISEVCKMQLKLSPKNEMMKKFLIGTRFHVEKAIAKAKPHECDGQYCYDSSAMETRERLAREFSISVQTVYKYGVLAETLTEVAEISEELFWMVMNKEVKVSIETLQAIMKLSPTPRNQAFNKLLNGNRVFGEEVRPAIQPKNSSSGERVMGTQSVKEPPKYDPNSELKSLIYTVPTWEGSIMRVMKVANMEAADLETKQKLRLALVSLTGVISNFLYEMEESNNGGVRL